MEAIEALKRTIHVTEELHSLVKTMKILAGLNIRLYERAARAVAEYNRTILFDKSGYSGARQGPICISHSCRYNYLITSNVFRANAPPGSVAQARAPFLWHGLGKDENVISPSSLCE